MDYYLVRSKSVINANVHMQWPIPVQGLVIFSQDESGHTEVTGIFKKGFEDTKASYGFKIVDECKNTLFRSHGWIEYKSGWLRRKRHCNSSKFKKRGPNGAMTTQNGEGHGSK
ncbi:unnamed protein product [Rhizophagus irregularis]|nr:unnamed protein product [Rhizophagus irregularis]